MGTIYARGNKLWIGYKDADGSRKYAPTKFIVGQESKAAKVLEAIERRIQATAGFGEPALGPLTVKRYLASWIKDRRLRNVASAGDDETRLQRHALPELGELLLAEVRPSHIRSLVRSLKAKVGQGRAQLAPRTVRHVYGVLHRMFEDAVADELIESNPCSIKRGELPAKIDKDPTWRSGAVFTREEVEQLISDKRIPEDRRVFYAIAFLGGLRTGAVSGQDRQASRGCHSANAGPSPCRLEAWRMGTHDGPRSTSGRRPRSQAGGPEPRRAFRSLLVPQ